MWQHTQPGHSIKPISFLCFICDKVFKHNSCHRCISTRKMNLSSLQVKVEELKCSCSIRSRCFLSACGNKDNLSLTKIIITHETVARLIERNGAAVMSSSICISRIYCCMLQFKLSHIVVPFHKQIYMSYRINVTYCCMLSLLLFIQLYQP